MGKLVSIVTTCLVVLSSKLISGKLAETADTTTDCHGHDGPSQGLVSKHLEILKLGTEIDSLNFVTTWQDGLSRARQTVTDPLIELSL